MIQIIVRRIHGMHSVDGFRPGRDGETMATEYRHARGRLEVEKGALLMNAACRILRPLAAAWVTMLLLMPAGHAYSDREAAEIFRLLDSDRDGKVTRDEYEVNKVQILYRGITSNPIEGAKFSETRVTRQFFDSADSNRDGSLAPHEAIDALTFSSVAGESQDFFEIDALRKFLRSISR